MSSQAVQFKRRDPWFDNARWLAGSLVVMVHVTGGAIAAGTLAEWLHAATNPARIPLFAVLVGYFTPAVPSARNYSNLVRTVMVPLFVIGCLHAALNLAWDMRPLFNPLLAPYTLWFMVSVISWRLICPVIARFKRPITVAVVLSVVSGSLANFGVLHLRLTFGFLPLVMLGMALRSNDSLVRRQTRWSVLVALAVVAAWVAAVSYALSIDAYDRQFVAMGKEFEGEGVLGLVTDAAARVGLLLALGLTVLAIMHLAPRVHIRWITYIGAGGFTIYLLHGLIVRVLREWGFLPTLDDPSWTTTLAFVLFSFALAALLGSKPVRWLSRPLLRPRLNWLLAHTPDEPEPVGRIPAPQEATRTSQ